MSDNENMSSIGNGTQSELGGVRARKGFKYQDHVAISYCLEMLKDSVITEVWCEISDDITLIKDINGEDILEFVQVKSTDLDQLWSISKLTEKENSASGKKLSILEKSLNNDSLSGKAYFRIVTKGEIKRELRILREELFSEERNNAKDELKELRVNIQKRLPSVKSPNDNDIEYWINNAQWEETGSEKAVIDKNLIKLAKIVAGYGSYLAPDQIEVIYEKLLNIVSSAAASDVTSEKKITINNLDELMKKIILDARYPRSESSNNKMVEKMRNAELPEEYIDTAKEQRRLFLYELYSPKYMPIDDIDIVAGQVQSKLLKLRVDLDTSSSATSGIDFFRKCINELENLENVLREQFYLSPTIVQGAMHELANRCLHRYVRIKT